MRKSMILRLAGFIGAAGLTAALVGSAVAGTGAYFSESAPTKTISATLGSIHLNSSAINDLTFTNMLPGESSTQTATFSNSGTNPEDVWVVFAAADIGVHDHLSTVNYINNKGTFGEALIKAAGTPVFYSNNLNDDSSSCAPGTGAPFICNPLPHMLKLADNLAPSAVSNMEFTYTPAAKSKGASSENTAAFLPIHYTIVATQHGIAPDNSLNTTPVP